MTVDRSNLVLGCSVSPGQNEYRQSDAASSTGPLKNKFANAVLGHKMWKTGPVTWRVSSRQRAANRKLVTSVSRWIIEYDGGRKKWFGEEADGNLSITTTFGDEPSQVGDNCEGRIRRGNTERKIINKNVEKNGEERHKKWRPSKSSGNNCFAGSSQHRNWLAGLLGSNAAFGNGTLITATNSWLSLLSLFLPPPDEEEKERPHQHRAEREIKPPPRCNDWADFHFSTFAPLLSFSDDCFFDEDEEKWKEEKKTFVY